jgi:hypothetical protein
MECRACPTLPTHGAGELLDDIDAHTANAIHGFCRCSDTICLVCCACCTASRADFGRPYGCHAGARFCRLGSKLCPLAIQGFPHMKGFHFAICMSLAAVAHGAHTGQTAHVAAVAALAVVHRHHTLWSVHLRRLCFATFRHVQDISCLGPGAQMMRHQQDTLSQERSDLQLPIVLSRSRKNPPRTKLLQASCTGPHAKSP